jgi:ribosome biogenesis GTPase
MGMQGKIIKGIAGFYYVHVPGSGTFECKAKGIFRNRKVKPLVGDNVELEVLDAGKHLGSITDILERRNELIRPAVANVDQALVLFAVASPKPNLNLLDRFLVMMDKQGVDTILCFNKTDLAGAGQVEWLKQAYSGCGCDLHFLSLRDEEHSAATVRELLTGRTTVLAGPSGVGKSTLTNRLCDGEAMEVGSVSDRIGRGRHTTRHSEILDLWDDTYIVDTPGFTSFYVSGMEADQLHHYVHEFAGYEGKCRFNGCVHVNEPDCAVKSAVSQGLISPVRYDNYVEIYNELKTQRKY